jgi:hypothetical protein
MFIKQLVRCPYLYHSDEFKIFVRPTTDVIKGLSLLPKLNNQRILERTTRYYSILGDLDDEKLLLAINL